MYKLFSLTISVSIACCYALAGNDHPCRGTRSAALGGASVTLTDLFSAVNNQAGLAAIKHISAGIFYENHFLIPQLALRSAALAVPLKSGTFGLNFTSFGYHSYNENKYSVGFGKALSDRFSVGLQLNYLYIHIDENYNNCHNIAAEAGLQAQLTQNLRLGVHLFNPTHHKLKAYNEERIPTVIRFGMHYTFNENVTAIIETEKDIDLKPLFKAGAEYHAMKQFYLRAGISNNPSLFSFGFGIQLQQFKLDVASCYNNLLGFSPNIACCYQFNRNMQ